MSWRARPRFPRSSSTMARVVMASVIAERRVRGLEVPTLVLHGAGDPPPGRRRRRDRPAASPGTAGAAARDGPHAMAGGRRDGPPGGTAVHREHRHNRALMRSYTSGMAGIAILDYDPTWPDQFEQLAAALRRHLGDTVMGMDHIGSTAVPGLAAKDVIDLQVTVTDLADADRLAPAFQRTGYVATPYRLDHRPAGDVSDPGLWEKRLWQSASGAGRRVNVHVRVAGWPNQRYALLFRDYLRAHPRAAAAYARLKRELARRLGDDLTSYTEVKDPACDLIIVAAQDWAATGRTSCS